MDTVTRDQLNRVLRLLGDAGLHLAEIEDSEPLENARNSLDSAVRVLDSVLGAEDAH